MEVIIILLYGQHSVENSITKIATHNEYKKVSQQIQERDRV